MGSVPMHYYDNKGMRYHYNFQPGPTYPIYPGEQINLKPYKPEEKVEKQPDLVELEKKVTDVCFYMEELFESDVLRPLEQSCTLQSKWECVKTMLEQVNKLKDRLDEKILGERIEQG